MKTYGRFFCRGHKLAVKKFRATLSIFVSLIVTCC